MSQREKFRAECHSGVEVTASLKLMTLSFNHGASGLTTSQARLYVAGLEK